MPTINTFPPITLPEYHEQANENIELYEGRAYNVFEVNKLASRSTKRQNETYLQKNIFRVITDTFVNLSVFEPVEISLDKTQEWWDEYAEDCEFQEFIKKAFKRGSICGDALAVIYEESTNYYKVKLIDNSIWEPIFDSNNIEKEADVNILNYEYEIDKKEYKVQRVYSYDKETDKTTVELKVNNSEIDFESIPDKIKQDFGLTEDMSSNEIDGKLFFRFKNEESLRNYFGLSDYTESVRAVGENLNDLLELETLVQEKTGDPDRTIPRGVVEAMIGMTNSEVKGIVEGEGKTFSSIATSYLNTGDSGYKKAVEYLMNKNLNRKLKNLPIDMEDPTPQYIQPVSTIDYIHKSIDKRLELLAQDLALPTVLLNDDFRTGQISGVALQKMMTRTLHKKNAREIRMKGFLREIITALLKLNSQAEEKPTVKFADGIINDKKEKIEEIQTLLNNELITRIDAVKELHGLTEKQARKYLDEIDTQNGTVNDEPIQMLREAREQAENINIEEENV